MTENQQQEQIIVPWSEWVFPNSYIEIQTYRVDGNSGCGLGEVIIYHESGTFMNGISAFVKETPQSSPPCT